MPEPQSFLEPNQYLEPSQSIDSSDERVVRQAKLLLGNCTDQRMIIERFFQYVRDHIIYYSMPDSKPVSASETLVCGLGNSEGKACLLAALCRTAGIPAGISFQQVQDMKFTGPDKRNSLQRHAIVNVYLEGRWVKLDPSLDRWFAYGRSCAAPSFNGDQDVLLPEKDWKGNDNYKIIKESPIYNDIPKTMFEK